MKKFLLSAALFLFAGFASAANVNLAWDASASEGVLGYKIHFGNVSGQYTTIVDVGDVLTATIPDLPETGATFYFVATAYDALEESVYSNEVSKQIGAPPPPPPGTGPFSLFQATDSPYQAVDADSAPVTLGVRFTSSVPGKITAIKYYSAAAGTGTNTYQLWDATGAALASKTVARPAAEGWTTVVFATPVQIQADTEYTASVWLSKAMYFGDDGGFSSAVTSGTLTAPVGAGVYTYGATPTRPTDQYQNENYWVDVVFVPGGVTHPKPKAPVIRIAP